MSWFRLEGRGAFHHKVLAAGNEAYGAWCRAGQHAAEYLTDGFIPGSVARQIEKSSKVWRRLVEARLIDEVEGGYQIHDFLDWNPSSDQERAKRDAMREKRRENGRAGGKRSGEVRRGEANAKQTRSTDEANVKQSASLPGEANAKQNEPPSPSPSPSISQIPPTPRGGNAPEGSPPFALEPAPTPTKRPRQRRPEQPMPKDWTPTDEHTALAAKEGVDMQREAQKFRFWAEGKLAASWNGRFATWLMKAGEERRSRGEPPYVPPPPPRPHREPPPPIPVRRSSPEEQRAKQDAALARMLAEQQQHAQQEAPES